MTSATSLVTSSVLSLKSAHRPRTSSTSSRQSARTSATTADSLSLRLRCARSTSTSYSRTMVSALNSTVVAKKRCGSSLTSWPRDSSGKMRRRSGTRCVQSIRRVYSMDQSTNGTITVAQCVTVVTTWLARPGPRKELWIEVNGRCC